MTDKLEQLKADYKKLGETIERLEKGGGVWKPERCDRYWFVAAYGDVTDAIWINKEHDQYRLSCGNVFRTKEEAAMYLKTKKRMLELSKDFEEGDKNGYLYFNCDAGYWEHCVSYNREPATFYYLECDAELLIKEHNQGTINLDLTLGRWC